MGETSMYIFRLILPMVVLLLASPVHGHVLNMTEVTLSPTADEHAARVVVRIDLGQSLLSPEQYWSAVNAEKELQARLLAPALDTLASGLVITQSGVPVSLELRSWALEAVSLDAIQNPLTPQMATLTYRASGLPEPLQRSNIEVRLRDTLEVPWPCLLRVEVADSSLPFSRLLTQSQRSSGPFRYDRRTDLDRPEELLTGLVTTFQNWLPAITWLAVGFQHIVPLGLDHIVFVLGLFFLNSSLVVLLWQVTCFTIAHSITLALAMFGVLAVNATLVEILIAASIVFIGVDNLRQDHSGSLRLLVVGGFGLLHGLGFASALQGLNMPEQDFVFSLVMFNLGVELGQLLVLAAAFLVLGWWRKAAFFKSRIAQPASVSIAGVGLFWLIKRAVLS